MLEVIGLIDGKIGTLTHITLALTLLRRHRQPVCADAQTACTLASTLAATRQASLKKGTYGKCGFQAIMDKKTRPWPDHRRRR